MEKLFYSIGEVSELLGIPVSKIRFWTNSFSKQLNPRRTAKGNRQYTAADIEMLRKINFLTSEKGLTLEGVHRQLKEDGSSVDKTVKALESLKNIREQLTEIRKSL